MSVREVVAIGDPVLRERSRELDLEEIASPEIQKLAVMINPTIEPLGEELIEINEGCLSVPDLRGSLERPLAIRIRYLDRQGVQHEEVKRGLTAGTFQHEVDHLNGVLFVDRADPRTFATWAQFDLHQRDEFLRRVARISDALES